MLMLDRWAVDQTRRLQQEIANAYETYQFHQVVQKLHNFCVTELGGFYLDIIKDRQYTMATNSRGRRSAQTALYHIVNAFVRWMAPIMSFTAEEIWQYIPGEKDSSVMFATWYEDLAELPTSETMNSHFWYQIRGIRDAVNKEIENQRNAGHLGSALEAEVSLYCGEAVKPLLDLLGDELRFVLIVSNVNVIQADGPVPGAVATDIPGLDLKITPTAHPKCERCWHRRVDVGFDPAYPGICRRCVENVAGPGELRYWA
jgi:isoleucyl-tRNA synthetase